MRLDVIDLIAKPLEADDVLQGLPDDSRNRNLRHHPEEHNLLSRHRATSRSTGRRYLGLAVETPRSINADLSSRKALPTASAIFGSAIGWVDASALCMSAASGRSSSRKGQTDCTTTSATRATVSLLTEPS